MSTHYPWWRKDRHGWPIEYITGRPVRNFVRTILQNVRKKTAVVIVAVSLLVITIILSAFIP